MVFLAESNSVKNGRYSAVEICCTDIMRMELVTGTLNLHLCAPPRFGCCPEGPCQSMCMAGTCLGAGKGEATPRQAAGQGCFTHLPGPGTLPGGHRGFILTDLLVGYKNLS